MASTEPTQPRKHLPPPRRPADLPHRRAGFTFVELMLGMVVTSMVMLALAAVAMSAAQGWYATADQRIAPLHTSQTAQRLGRLLAGARYVGYVNTGSVDSGYAEAGLVLWKDDNWNGSPDGRVQVAEMLYLEHAGGRLYVHEAIPQSQMTWVQLNGWGNPYHVPPDYRVSYSEMNSSQAPPVFKSLDYVTPATRVLSGDLAGVQFSVRNLDSPNQRPTIDFVLKFRQDRDGKTTYRYEYGSATLRCPAPRPKE